MAMNPKDVQLRNGNRQPSQPVRTRGTEWGARHRTFTHEALHRALQGLLGAKEVKP